MLLGMYVKTMRHTWRNRYPSGITIVQVKIAFYAIQIAYKA